MGTFVVMYEQHDTGRCREHDGTYAYWDTLKEVRMARDRLAAANLDAVFYIAEAIDADTYTYYEG
jgi:hypothetical protein